MKYMGSKNRHAKELLPVVLKNRKRGQCYVEPFVGGGNMIDKVNGDRIGFDSDSNVIEALISIRDSLHRLPKSHIDFTEDEYNNLRKTSTYSHRGYAGFAFSYGGKWLGGWRRDGAGKRDYIAEAYRNAKKQSPYLQGVRLTQSDYMVIDVPHGSIIYCDPPYQGTTKYKSGEFNYIDFWAWCREKVLQGHSVFISEYSAPDDFECLWEKKVNSNLGKDTGFKKNIERLFAHKSQLHGQSEVISKQLDL